MTRVNSVGTSNDVSIVCGASLDGVGSWSIMDANNLLYCLLPRQLMVYLVTL